MKKLILAILLVFMPLVSIAQKKEIRAVWFTTLNGLDWPRTKATTPANTEKQKKELTDMLDKLKAVNINTILFQTRIRGSVVYPSALQPWDHCLTGTPGKSPGYDPLRFVIDECHKRGMECHAWVVTLPLGKWNEMGCKQMRQKYPKAVKRVGENGFLNPEVAQTADIVADICAEITKNYNVDGIHLDYARYPDGWNIKVSRQQGRDNITRLVRTIHDKVKAIRPSVKMSCSPVGKYKDLSRYSSRGWNAYQKVCQDAQGWLQMGLMDQLYPMIYFKGNDFYPFATDWAEHLYGKEVAAGLGIWFLDKREGNWKIDEVIRQLNIIRQLGLGQCHFRTKFLLDNHQGLYDYLRVFNFADCWPEETKMPLSHTPIDLSQQSDIQQGRTNEGKKDLKAGKEHCPFIRCIGKTITLPRMFDNFDANRISFESHTGVVVATKPFRGMEVDVHDLPNGSYVIRVINSRNVSHRLAFLEVKR
ncbi:MAG: family 10 glycosylhydrolase [Prevotella sp.]|nr:family 10 glycosylhydrolase [Prevotella sp.]